MENTFVVQPTLSTFKSTCGYERDQWACCEWKTTLTAVEHLLLVSGGPILSAVKSTCGYERDQWACCE